MLDPLLPQPQPSAQSVLQRMGHDLSAKAVLLVHENGQVLERSGRVEEREYPAMAALVTAMIAAGKSLSLIGESFRGSPTRFSCDSDSMGLYTVAVTNSIWLAVLYPQPLNPGLFRMKVRRYSETLARLGVERAHEWEAIRPGHPGANLSPEVIGATTEPENFTQDKASLFGNITDDEIDKLFENASS